MLSVSENIWDILRFLWVMIRHRAWHLSADCPARPRESRVTGKCAATRRYSGQKPDGCRATNGSCGGKIQLLVARETHGGCGHPGPFMCELWILRILDIFSEGIMSILSENSDQGYCRWGNYAPWMTNLTRVGRGIKRKFQNHLNSLTKFFENKSDSPRKSNILKKSPKLSFYTFCPVWLTWLL